MRMPRLPLIAILFGILLSFPPTVSVADIVAQSRGGRNLVLYKDYYALVIGVSNYEKWPKIPFATQDAKEVAERLELQGFKTKVVVDPTHREMLTALTEMVYVMGRDENRALLLYYAGHGDTETLADKTKMGYIIPKDCPLLKDDPMGFATHAISMREIESISLRIKSKHVLMLFDSCFSGSLFTLVRAVPHDITEKSTLPVRQYITAGSEEEEVPDRSVFKRCLLIGLEGDADLTGDGYITGSELGMYLADNVVNYTKRAQHPQYGKINNPDLDRGDFIFVPPKRRQGSVTGDKGAVEERSAEAEELERLREEKKRNEETVAELKKTLQESERLEKESKKFEVEKAKPQGLPALFEGQEVGRDGVYIAYANGIVKDTKTGLEWVAGPDWPMNQNDAMAWAESLNVGGGGWRLPTVAELKGLYQYGKGKSNMTPLLKTKGSWVWSSQDTPVSGPRYFNFNNGQEGIYGKGGPSMSSLLFFRAFAVRSRTSG